MNYIHLELLPLYLIAFVFTCYTAQKAWDYYWYESPYTGEDIEDIVRNITPTETPFMARLRKDYE